MLIVGDAFGGKLAVIDGTAGSMVSFRSIPAHNIGGICVDSKNNRVIISHQHLNHRSETTADSIHWGFLLTNSLRTIRMKDLLDPTADLGASSHLAHLGEPGTGGGDPFEPVVLANDEVMTALGGVGQVAIGPSDDPDRKRFAAGTKPTAIVLSPDKKFAYVANSLDDTLSVITVASGEVHSISLGPRPADNEIDLGERLFYDAKLSHEGWMSCQSCHGEGHTNGRLADTFGDGSFGAPKEVLSLLGVRDTAPYSWNGGIADLETQVRKSIKTTMRKDQSTDQQVRALTAFLRTLDAPPLVSSKDLDQSALKRGEVIFFERKCDRCHKPPTFTSPKAYDVNLKDEVGNSAYNPPSLRGVGRRSPYFHDGRARRLEDVFTRYGHPLDSVFTDQEAADLVIFLRSL
jgi:mono/diheme cytochrome c family protein